MGVPVFTKGKMKTTKKQVYTTDSFFGPRNAKNHTFPTSIIRTPLKRTIGSVPLVFVLKKFDCIYITGSRVIQSHKLRADRVYRDKAYLVMSYVFVRDNVS